MYKLLTALILLLAFAFGSAAQPVTTPQIVAIGCAYNTALPILTTATFGLVQCDVNGQLLAAGSYAAGSTTSGQFGTLAFGAVTTAAPSYTTAKTDPLSLLPNGNLRTAAFATDTITNPTSTLTLPTTITQYSAGTLVCTSATVATCNTALQSEFFSIPNTAGGTIIPRLRLSVNDNTATAWNGQTLQVDLWSTYPTFQTTGDRGVFITDFLTGSASHLGAYTCVMAGTANTAYGDGTYAECYPAVATASFPKLASGTSIFWTLTAVTGTFGTTGASGVFTLTAELLN